MSNKICLNSGREWGKHYTQIINFIASVKSGKKALLIGVDYVCMSRKEYDKLTKYEKIKA